MVQERSTVQPSPVNLQQMSIPGAASGTVQGFATQAAPTRLAGHVAAGGLPLLRQIERQNFRGGPAVMGAATFFTFLRTSSMTCSKNWWASALK
jgi:hypothetical protein